MRTPADRGKKNGSFFADVFYERPLILMRDTVATSLENLLYNAKKTVELLKDGYSEETPNGDKTAAADKMVW